MIASRGHLACWRRRHGPFRTRRGGDTRSPTPTPRSPRHGRPAAATPVTLGPKDGGVYPVGDGFGQNFAGGKIFFTPATGAHIMQGAILEKYESLGGPADSDLGFPTIDEGPGRAPDSRNTTFSAPDKPVIFLTPDTGARVVRGPINAAWDKLGGSAGVLGVPAEDEAYRGDVITQKFTGGELSYDAQAKTFTTVPPDLAGQLDGLRSPTTRRRRSTRPGAPPGERWARWAPPRARRTRSAPTASARISPAARSSTAPTPVRTSSPARSWPSTRASAARRATSDSRPPARSTAGSRRPAG